MWSNDIHECVHIYVHTNSLRGIFLTPPLTSYKCPVCSVLFASKLYLRDICQSFTFFYMSKQVWRQAFYTIWRKSLLKYKYISVYINIYTVYISSPSLHSSTENKLLEPGVSPTSIPAKWSPAPFMISLQAVSLRVVLADLNLFAREFVVVVVVVFFKIFWCGSFKKSLLNLFQYCCCCSVTKSCLTLCNPMGCSMPSFPVLHHLLELAQTHVHWVGDAIQPSYPLSSPSPPAFNLSHHQGLFQWVGSFHQVVKILELQLQHQSFQWIIRADFL